MQQTQNYKLNLIETSDTFSPNPLNENAVKTEAMLAALEGADTLVGLDRIGGTLDRAVVGGELSIDLSGVDMGRYAALVVVFSGSRCLRGCNLLLNGLDGVVLLPAYSLTQSYQVSGMGCALITRVGDSIYGLTKVYATVKNAADMTNCYYRNVELPWEELSELTTEKCPLDGRLSVFGLRI